MIDATAHPTALEERRAGITDRGRAVLAILRAQDLVRELDAADRDYLVPLVAELLVDVCAEPTATR